MKISFGSWAFAFGPYCDNPIPLGKIAERLASAGYDGVEVGGFPPHVTLESYPDRGSRVGLKRQLADLGLGVSGYAGDFTMLNPTVPARHDAYLDLFKRNVELCVDIGSPSLRVDTVAAPGSIPDTEYQAAMQRLARTWHEAAEVAARAGIRMLWEFEPGFVFNKPSEVVDLYERVGHPNFHVLFDTCHAYLCGVVGARQTGVRETLAGGVGEFLDTLSGRIGHVHMVDTDGTLYGDETSRHCPLGAGKIDFRRLAPQLASLPGIEWWCIDLCFWEGSWELIEPSLHYVKGLLER